MKTYGAFEQNGREFVITERKTPRHWYNYFYNDTYNAFISQVGVGESLMQDRLANRIMLVSDRAMYLTDKDSGKWFSANGIPLNKKLDSFRCRHGLGYTTTESQTEGIKMEYTVFVPLKGSREIWMLTAENLRDTTANLSAIGYAGTMTDGSYRPQGYNLSVAGFDKPSQAAMHRIYTEYENDGVTIDKYGYLITDGEVIGFDTRKNAFIGVYGSAYDPEALNENNGCTNSDCVGEKLCYALEVKLVLAPGEKKTICFEIGVSDTVARTVAMREHLRAGLPAKELEAVKAVRAAQNEGANITTPDEQLNLAFNGFYKYATGMGSRWARVRHNGYRDLMSDTECMAAYNPTLAWERYKRILTYQYSNGYAPRTFIGGAIKDNKFADCAVWIPFAGYAIIMELGDLNLLNEVVEFNDGTSATVYEHIRRSVEYLYNFKGAHGMVKIWGGDWNDCMNTAGLKGLGESVWLSIAWYRANNMLMELAKLTGKDEDVTIHAEMGEKMKALINEYGWDGKWFITAINDEGMKIGSEENEEGKIYLNPQVWAVFSGLGTDEQIKSAFEAVDTYLDGDLGAAVSKPSYTHIDMRVGSMTQKPAGVHENGGVYLHALAWKLAAEGMLHRPEKVERIIHQFLPWDHTHAVTVGEPYMLYNSYFDKETGYRFGTPGQSWRTGSIPWFIKSVLMYVYGLQPEIAGLNVKPCLPPSWKECAVEKDFRGCHYVIRYHQTEGEGNVKSITADGVKIEGTLLPYAEGKTIEVDVEIG